MEKIAVGDVVGYGVISECDQCLDSLGKRKPGSVPILWESSLMNEHQARHRAERMGRFGRRLIVKLVVVEEVV